MEGIANLNAEVTTRRVLAEARSERRGATAAGEVDAPQEPQGEHVSGRVEAGASKA
jgi:hypothetical protein